MTPAQIRERAAASIFATQQRLSGLPAPLCGVRDPGPERTTLHPAYLPSIKSDKTLRFEQFELPSRIRR